MDFYIPTDKGERIIQALASRVCTLPDGSFLFRSNGRQKAGRMTRYTAHYANGWNYQFRAANDEQAVTMANKKGAGQP